jgi:hypothetical protein
MPGTNPGPIETLNGQLFVRRSVTLELNRTRFGLSSRNAEFPGQQVPVRIGRFDLEVGPIDDVKIARWNGSKMDSNVLETDIDGKVAQNSL